MDSLLLMKAADYAARAHSRQRRKDEEATPYINHVVEVGFLLAEARCEVSVVAAGLLHDTVEDTGTTHEELAALFGERIARLVQAVTDDRSLPKAVRKEKQVEHARQATFEVGCIKTADKISNLRSIHVSPPAGWSQDRKLEYIAWADRVVTSLPRRNEHLMIGYRSARALFGPE
ncbi:MAG: bifunctional (p)ppGpp synthetase/guanosine-3',5'-bis(diphosphate) 3'-pyrophosphohydrolase [Acidobacteria bacterium]|nr:bifunctional (p)ppGpp synthetase/guanosine-3',5'-bis(diphosphate) 3'-pyrophosphohydrolase [Acidobacteriota bacterium]